MNEEKEIVQINLSAGVLAELRYLIELNRDNPFRTTHDSVEDLIAHVMCSVADGSRRPGSWERTVISAMGLTSSRPEHLEYRAAYGPPSIIPGNSA